MGDNELGDKVMLQDGMGPAAGGYPKDQMVSVIGNNPGRRVSMLSEMDRLVLVQSERKANQPCIVERLKERPSIITEKMMSVLENTNDRHAMLLTGRQTGKSQAFTACLEFDKWQLDQLALKKLRIRAALRAKTKKGPKRRTYSL